MKKLSATSQEPRRSSRSSPRAYAAPKPLSTAAWQEHHNSPADFAIGEAPVNIIRRKYNSTGGAARLLESVAGEGAVEIGILSVEQADHLADITRRRVIPWVRFCTGGNSNAYRDPFLSNALYLQGMRLDDSFHDTMAQHKLYDYVRKQMQRHFPMSPLPRDKITGLLLMATWSTGPTKGLEFMDSWLLSGYASQQAMLHINFTNTTQSLEQGRMTDTDKDTLRMWSAICLCHLQYSVGTGRPSTIAPIYLEQSRVLLDDFDAVMVDGFEVSSIILFSSLQSLYAAQASVDYDEIFSSLQQWRKQWNHLFDSLDEHRFMLEISYNFCLLVLAKRAAAPRTSTVPASNSSNVSQRSHTFPAVPTAQDWTTSFRSYAQRVVDYGQIIPTETFEEIPEFYHLCIVYAIMILAQFTQGPNGDQELKMKLENLLQYWSGANLSSLFTTFRPTLESFLDPLENEDVGVRSFPSSPGLQEIFNSVFSL
ncbi:Transcriptional activator of proteases prtT [Paramyrothecium foliicola]|nr:Transcriptional activator of proteases prtT [Paramyrothecium foliicola]